MSDLDLKNECMEDAEIDLTRYTNKELTQIREAMRMYANRKLKLFAIPDVSKRYIVCTDINYKNELTVISHEFTDIEDAELFKKHCLETEKYKGKNLLILNVC